MQTVRHIRLFRNGRNQALRIPREFEFDGNEATVRKDGNRLIVEPVQRKLSLTEWLASLEPVDEDIAEIDDPPAESEDVF